MIANSCELGWELVRLAADSVAEGAGYEEFLPAADAFEEAGLLEEAEVCRELRERKVYPFPVLPHFWLDGADWTPVIHYKMRGRLPRGYAKHMRCDANTAGPHPSETTAFGFEDKADALVAYVEAGAAYRRAKR